MLSYKGLSCAVFTPMHEDGSINLDLIPDYAAYLNANQIKGIFVNGTTGEGNYSLTLEERKRLAEAWMAQKSLIPHIVIQVGGCNFTEAKILAAHAEAIGASGIGILPNCFERPHSLDDLIDWIGHIAEAAPSTPALYYHLPKYTNVHFPMHELLSKGAKRIPTLCGMKFSSSDVADVGRILALRRPQDGDRFLILFGSDDSFLGHYGMGINAAIGSTYNFAPKLFTHLMEAIDAGHLDKARDLQNQVIQMFGAIFKHGPGTAPQKYAMELMTGLKVGPPRFPLKQLSPDQVEEMRRDLEELKIEFVFQKH